MPPKPWLHLLPRRRHCQQKKVAAPSNSADFTVVADLHPPPKGTEGTIRRRRPRVWEDRQDRRFHEKILRTNILVSPPTEKSTEAFTTVCASLHGHLLHHHMEAHHLPISSEPLLGAVRKPGSWAVFLSESPSKTETHSSHAVCCYLSPQVLWILLLLL